MGIENRYQGIDGYGVWLIRKKAKQLVGRAGFTESDREDLEQEMILDLLSRLPKYDSTRAKRNTFIARVVEHKVATLIAERKAQKRDYRTPVCSLNDRLGDMEGNSIEREATINQEDYFCRTRKLTRSIEDHRDLSIDTRDVIAELPPELKKLCFRLQCQTIAEIVRETGIPRSTIYESIKKLRALFEEAGLGDYL